jgi:hypothetical protein
MTDEELDSLQIRNKVFEDVEVPYQKEELGSDASSSSESESESESSSSDSDSDDSDDNSDGDDDEGRKEGRGRAMLTAGTTATSTTSGDNSGDDDDDDSNSDSDDESDESEEEVEEEVMGADGVMVVVKSFKKKKKGPTEAENLGDIRPKTPMPVEEATQRSLGEASSALERMRSKYVERQARAKAYREHELARHERETLAAEAAAEKATNGDVEYTTVSGKSVSNGQGGGNSSKSTSVQMGDDGIGGGAGGGAGGKGPGVVSDAGFVDPVFDPSKGGEYSEEELTAMATEQMRRNAANGLDADGNKIRRGLF